MRHVRVAIDLGGARGDCLTYSDTDLPGVEAGALVLAPVRGRRALGICLGETEPPDFKTRSVEAVRSPVRLPGTHLQVAAWLARYYRVAPFEGLRLLLPPGLESRVKAHGDRLAHWPATESRSVPGPLPRAAVLSRDQGDACQEITSAMHARRPEVFLLHGITGSGKTHVFLEAAAEAIKRGEQVVILVSDISLTPEALARIERRFPNRVGVLHSEMAEGTRARTWRAIHDGQVDIVVGTRSALYAPAHRLGLIVIDEEHEPSYKQEAAPRYHAREVAVQLARFTRAPLVLSSATPDVCSYYRAEQGQYRLLSLPERVAGVQRGRTVRAELPPVEIVDMRREIRAGHVGLLSRSLEERIGETLEAGLQVMLFLNRRGTATSLTCRVCGQAVECRRCSVPFGYHQSNEQLICHRCGRKAAVPKACPRCGAEDLRALGAGVQRVEAETRKKFPRARVVRWDRDATATRGAHEELWRSFSAHESDILVGTQMIGKGLDFPDVTLVGIVLAESQLFFPDIRAAERTFEVLTQVAGRAGRRADRGGRVVLQTYVPDHYAIRAAARHDYLDLYRRELAFRRQQAYPPFRPLIRLVHSASSAEKAEEEAVRVGRRITEMAEHLGLADFQMIGPAPSFIARLRGRYRWHLILAGANAMRILDEVPLGRAWTVDVDPMETL